MLNKFFGGIKDIWFCTKYFAKFAWKHLPIYYLYILMSVIISTAGPFVSIIGSKYLINEIVYEQNRNMNMIIFWVAFICIGTYIHVVGNKFANEKQNYCNDQFDRMLRMEISSNTMKMKFEYTENSEMLDSINKAGRAFEQTNLIQGLTDGIVGLLSNILVLAGVIYIVVKCSVWLIIPVLLSFVVNTYITMKTTKIKEQYFSEAMEMDRVVDYYIDELTTGEYAKDIRIYHSDDMIIDNQKKQSNGIYNLSKKSEMKIWNKDKAAVTTTFGIETFLEHFLRMTESPLPRMSDQGLIDPIEEPFSGFVFKIQANMNKAHHDRIAFLRVCSGKFDASKDVYHVQSGKKMKLSRPQQIMAQDRKVIDEAYAGDVIGVFDPGIFSIGDTICTPGKKFVYEGIPTFAPEHFCRLVALDSMKRKQFMKGVTQIAQEGAIQIFQDYNLEMSEIIVGVVGTLQFDVLKYRMENEYGCDVRLEPLPYGHIRWVKDTTIDLNNVKCPSDAKRVKDMKGNPLVLFTNQWSIKLLLERNEGIEFEEFSRN